MKSQKELEEKITACNIKYREGNPIIEDRVYDSLIEELQERFPESLLLKKGVIDKAIDNGRKQQLPIPMYSLNKCKSFDELMKWAESKGLCEDDEFVISGKYDGISLVVNEYNKRCWTRGDGEVGQDSRYHYEKLIRREDEGKVYMFSFGEAIMSKKNFVKYSEEFANARNFVAGLFNRDITTEPLKEVDYIRYGSDDDVDKDLQLMCLNKINRVPVNYFKCKLGEIQPWVLEELYNKWSQDYKIDGLVIDVNDADERERLGREENMNPAYAVAYKNPEWSASAVVTVTGITWQVSKQGKLKPVIQIVPTEVGEVMISNVTGYNAAYIIDQKIAIDSVIKIIRSGDVIPKHIETISSDRNQREMLMHEIATCPFCDSQTKWDDTKVELVCTNPECRDKKIAKLTHFFATLEVEEFGEPSIIRLFNAGYETIYQILSITKQEMSSIEGFGGKSAETLLKQFSTLMKTGKPFAQIIDSLDLMEGKLGQKTIQLIFDNISSWQEITNISELTEISGVADITANIFVKGMRKYWDLNYEVFLLINVTYIQTPKVEVTGDKYKGQKICFTGCRASKEQEKDIQAQGGEVVGGVSKNTTLLVVKDNSEKTMSSGKAVEAKKLGIKVITINNL